MNEYKELVHERDETVDGIGPWYWIKTDTGAWDGPKTDWEENHKHKWLAHVTDWTNAIQCGGCMGMYPRILSKKFQDVYTFEPDPLSFFVLNLNCQKDSIHKYNAALGEAQGFIGLHRACQDNVGMNRVEGEGRTPVMTVDSFQFQTLGLLALDVEGYEIHIIRGALDTIARCHPVITCECATDEIKKILLELGYEQVDQSVSDAVFAYVG